ncbi:hypothetical protein AB0H73_10080 [Streptomyces olivoreticuli]
MSLADEYGTDLEIYRHDGTVYADTRTCAPGHLLARLDDLGFARKTAAIYTWHELPADLDEAETKRRCTLAALLLTAARYRANVTPDLYDKATHTAVISELKAR